MRTVSGMYAGWTQLGFPPAHRDGDQVSSDGYRLRRVSLLRYEIHHHGEPSIEFEFRNVGAPTRPHRLFRGETKSVLTYSAEGSGNASLTLWDGSFECLRRQMDEFSASTFGTTRNEASIVLVSYRYDERGNLIDTIDSSGHGFTCAYDAENRLIRRTGRKGFSFHFQYDSEGRCIKSTGDDRMHEVSLDYDPSGRVTKVTRADGGVWTYIFGDGGRLARVIDPLGGVQAFVSDKIGRVVQEVDPMATPRVCFTTPLAPL